MYDSLVLAAGDRPGGERNISVCQAGGSCCRKDKCCKKYKKKGRYCKKCPKQ